MGLGYHSMYQCMVVVVVVVVVESSRNLTSAQMEALGRYLVPIGTEWLYDTSTCFG